MAFNADKIAFILNPASGSGQSKKQAAALEKFLIENSPEALFKPADAAEASQIVAELAKKNYKAVVACGGDGTVNLVSKALLHSDTALMVIGLGSGNGYARHQRIPLNWEAALRLMEHPKESLRDTGLINGIHFINVAGIGFAARISEAFRSQTNRGLNGYVKTVIRNLKLQPFPVQMSNETGTWEGETWMVEFCNGTQWGNNFRLEPGARDDDGALNAVVFKKMSPIHIPALGFRFATNTVPDSSDVYSVAGARFSLETGIAVPVHTDGDSAGLMQGSIAVEVLPEEHKNMDGLIPVLKAESMRKADARTISAEPISAADLMERASGAVYRFIRKQITRNDRIAVICGAGNNGGDGWCISRMLASDGFDVVATDAAGNKTRSAENASKRHLFTQYKPGSVISSVETDLSSFSVIVDALFGSGLSRPLEGADAALAEQISSCGARVFSVDVPSGLYTEAPQNGAPYVRNAHTIAIESPFPSFFYAENQIAFNIVSAGIQMKSEGAFYLSPEEPWKTAFITSIPRKSLFSHKGDSGHVAIAGGFEGMHGAAALAASSAVEHGAGLTTVIGPAGIQTYLGYHPQVMHRVADLRNPATLPDFDRFSVLCVGPGFGTGPGASEFLHALLKGWNKPAVLDADALNLLAANTGLWNDVKPGSILTPHPGEFKRLFGETSNGTESKEIAINIASERGIYILAKNKYSLLACPDGEVYYNGSGSAELAQGGSGDRLCGAIGAWLGKTKNPKTAALAAMYLCGERKTLN